MINMFSIGNKVRHKNQKTAWAVVALEGLGSDEEEPKVIVGRIGWNDKYFRKEILFEEFVKNWETVER